MTHYNYIFTGSGLSALMTIYKMILSNNFENKSILLLDLNLKKNNDRTWCFWEKPNHKWENIVSKNWKSALFANSNISRSINLQPYEYNMIKGIDFYNFVFKLIEKQNNITFKNEKVVSFDDTINVVNVVTENQNYTCDKLFNSIYDNLEVENQHKYRILQQHFIGWFIKSDEEVFNENEATFMDFSVQQNGNTKFMYVLPTSKTEALLEPTWFSHKRFNKEVYENEIKLYAKKIGIKNYTITEKEQGSIPMTCFPFWKNNSKNVLNIGTAGGWTKASTGFTFYHTDKKTNQLIVFLQSNLDFTTFYKKTKFWFYDLIFLEVLHQRNELGSSVFSSLLAKGNSELVFKFLNEETTWYEDLQVMLRCPKIPFIKAFFKVLYSSTSSK